MCVVHVCMHVRGCRWECTCMCLRVIDMLLWLLTVPYVGTVIAACASVPALVSMQRRYSTACLFNPVPAQVAVSLVGRLAYQNPAYVLPSLRKTLIQLLTEVRIVFPFLVPLQSYVFMCAHPQW